ncbi:MAG: hypothetical protein M1484_05140 [Patescibacteria group bacterium]|nr:hypothetical protein [Patescibacteria group bacterium]MCL5432439.1 hypothetical protein [Patescibacteria group bacterium]
MTTTNEGERREIKQNDMAFTMGVVVVALGACVFLNNAPETARHLSLLSSLVDQGGSQEVINWELVETLRPGLVTIIGGLGSWLGAILLKETIEDGIVIKMKHLSGTNVEKVIVPASKDK